MKQTRAQRGRINTPGGSASGHPATARPSGKRTTLAVCVFLVVAVAVVFGQTVWHDFINQDDGWYVYENPVVLKGLSWEGFAWAWCYGEIGHWHPLTWLSHMLDCQIFGPTPGPQHLVNVALHAAAAVVLFLALRRMTRAVWPAAFVATVFAIHPLRVESVAWIAERKDVLSGLFFMLTLWAYARYVELKEQRLSCGRWYALTAVFFALGLLSKNMLVTLPCVLLLLDYWPLRRLPLSDLTVARSAVLRLVAEKVPLFALAAISCVITSRVPETVSSAFRLSFEVRLENGLVSYAIYCWQMVFPTGLAFPYLYPPGLHQPWWKVAAALALVGGLSVVVALAWRKRPFLLVGWLWYLGMLVPVIGIIQISYYSSHADRYTYLPQIGLYLAIAFAADEWTRLWRHQRLVLGALSALVIAVLMTCSAIQVSYWRDSASLWRHTLSVSPGNIVARINLDMASGFELAAEGKLDEAIQHYQLASSTIPPFADARYASDAHYNLGTLLCRVNRLNEAAVELKQALEIQPGNVAACNELARLYESQGKMDEAIRYYRTSLELNPSDDNVTFNLARLLAAQNQTAEAIRYYQETTRLQPTNSFAFNNLANLLVQNGRIDEAINYYRKAIQLNPRYAEANYNLGKILGLRGQTEEAIDHFRSAIASKPDFADAHGNLGNALATLGRWQEAAGEYRRTLELRPDSVQGHFRLGEALQALSDIAGARTQYELTLQLDPRHSEALKNLTELNSGASKIHSGTNQPAKSD